ncbi:MAG: capsular polysaccharide biosynthesis protein CapF [Lachnospiraceae bacterium]|nr:capsular polysaccharide biosynthesis protein CapF [Lachnospiraceae bacterium]
MKNDRKILVTGALGFIGRNLITELHNRGYDNICECDRETTAEELDAYLADCSFVFHLAGINRPKVESEFTEGNRDFTETLLTGLQRADNPCGVLISSSIQAELDNPYGKSKLAAEGLVSSYARQTGAPVFIYRLPGVFGKWCRPNYNSVVATFCYQIARGLPITVNDPDKVISLVYIDDVVNAFITTMEGRGDFDGTFCRVSPVHEISLRSLAESIQAFRESRSSLFVPDLGDPLQKKLYSTYLSYLAEDDFAYPLNMHKDARGSFTEFLKTEQFGQVSVNVAHPGITKGNHWHHTKNEKFLVVKGQACLRFRKVGETEVISYNVSGEDLQVIDIPTGYTHSITNTGEEDLVTIIWANETFDPERPDTYFEEVLISPQEGEA